MAEWQTRCLQVAVIFRSCGFNSHQPHHLFSVVIMDKELLESFEQWNIASVLPPSVGDFNLSVEQQLIKENGKEKGYVFFVYQDGHNDWTVRGSYNLGSEEYAVRVNIGMLEFALIEFITGDFGVYQKLVAERLPALIETHYVKRDEEFSVILKDKGVPDMPWQDILPSEYKGFECQVNPGTAVRIINGSYMIVAYYHEASQSGLSIMYNVLRDDFFSERRIHNFPNLVHEFDSHTIKELTESLKKYLLPVLDQLAADSLQE